MLNKPSVELNEMSQILMSGPEDIIIYLHYQEAATNKRHVGAQNLWAMIRVRSFQCCQRSDQSPNVSAKGLMQLLRIDQERKRSQPESKTGIQKSRRRIKSMPCHRGKELSDFLRSSEMVCQWSQREKWRERHSSPLTPSAASLFRASQMPELPAPRYTSAPSQPSSALFQHPHSYKRTACHFSYCLSCT